MAKKIVKHKHKIVDGLLEAIAIESPDAISLSKALDNSLDKLEQRMADYIARIDRILA